MSIENNKAIIRRAFETLNQGIIDEEMLDPNFVFHDPGVPQVSNRQEYIQLLTGLAATFSPHLTTDDMIAEGDKVVVRYTLRGTHQAPWRGVPATGKPVMFTATSTYRLTDGKVAEAWQNADTFGLLQQLGVFPS